MGRRSRGTGRSAGRLAELHVYDGAPPLHQCVGQMIDLNGMEWLDMSQRCDI